MTYEYNISHLYYTISVKCRGEGVFASSITKDEINELTRAYIIGYKQPSQLPSQPSDKEIADLFPIKKGCIKLNTSSKYVILCSRYTGKCNHTPNRYGNYLSHAIVFNESLDFIKLPILLKDYPFIESLMRDEEDAFQMASEQWLFNVSTSKVIEEIKNALCFLNKSENLKLIFAAIVDKILDGWLNNKKNNIVIRASKEDVTNFIYAIYTILPSHLINKIFFSTFVGTLRECPFQIVGIVPESVLDFSDNNLVFDLEQQSEYKIKNSFTQYIYELISTDNTLSLIDDKAKQIFDFERLLPEYINRMDKFQLNSIISSIKLKNRILHDSSLDIEEFVRIHTSISNDTEKKKLLTLIEEKNKRLFAEYLFVTINNSVSTTEKLDLLRKYFQEYIKNDEVLLKLFYPLIILPLKKKISISDNERLSTELFVNFNDVKQFIIHDEDLMDELINIDKWFSRNINNNERLLEQFIEKYSDMISLNLPFLYKRKIKKNLLSDIKNNIFSPSEEKYAEKILQLSESDKQQILFKYILTDNYINKFDLTFKKYMPIIERFCSESLFDFWKNFFSQKEINNENAYSISYLKRMFTITIIDINAYQGIIGKFRYTKYEKTYLIEHYHNIGNIDSKKIIDKVSAYSDY